MKRFLILLGLLLAVPSFACTSVIISGKASGTGAPVMFKHRDSSAHLDNRMEWFHGERYLFIGLVNAESAGGEVWGGTNQAGFSIMNTATYDLKDDDVPASEMDQEGKLMYRALEICATVEDFERFLDTLSRPMHVEANFGVIDASGGAAYYEVNNFKWVKFDVNADPAGYRVVTNFTQTGRKEDRKGEDRYLEAREIMARMVLPDGSLAFRQKGTSWHKQLMNGISRSGKPILRDVTSSTIIFEGVRPGSDPGHTVMWASVGYPTSTAYVPMMVMESDHLPSIVKKNAASDHCITCDIGLQLKEKDLMKEVWKTERYIDVRFDRLFGKWQEGKLSDGDFRASYDRLMDKYSKIYQKNFNKYVR